MIKIGICDDDESFIEVLLMQLSDIRRKYHYAMEIETYADGAELVKDMQAGTGFDILYLDIEMAELNGIETAQWIRKNRRHQLLIFVSGYEQYLRQLFEVEPFRFLSKPLDQKHFEEVFLKAYHRISEENETFFRFQAGKNVMNVLCRDILYFESNGRKVIVHTTERDYEYYDKLNAVEERVSGKRFVRIHKAYLVNMDNIEAFQYERVALTDGTILSISEKNRPRIRSAFWEYCKEDLTDG